MSVDITTENALTGTYTKNDMHTGQETGDVSVAGFARQPSVNIGETLQFSITGGSTLIRIFRAGWYGGSLIFREVDQIVNTPVSQPEGTTITNSFGGTTQTEWSVTAEWDVPEDATSGMYMAMIRNAANTDAFYASFVVRDDDAVADIIYKTSDATWGAAYNHYGLKSAIDGKNVYGSGTGVGNIMQRCVAVSYHRPVITRGGVQQTFWWACELPLIVWLESQGYTIKYVTSVDLDKQGQALLQKGKIFLSSGHDEYWSANMRNAVENWRDYDGGHSIFMSGNEVFWKVRFEYIDDETIMWCYKDTMPGPTGVSRLSGTPFDPVEWTGTWMDARWPDHRDGALLTGTKFGMNGVYDYDVVIPKNPYGGHKVWGGSTLVDSDITLTRILGFEADHVYPTQPDISARILAAYTRAAPGGLSDANGELYNVPGNIEWGIVSQRYASGAVTVGFGTCQWSWALNDVHDRGGATPVSLAAKQFTANLLKDLGATPHTLQPELEDREANNLDEYGLIPSNVWVDGLGNAYVPYRAIDGSMVPQDTIFG